MHLRGMILYQSARIDVAHRFTARSQDGLVTRNEMNLEFEQTESSADPCPKVCSQHLTHTQGYIYPIVSFALTSYAHAGLCLLESPLDTFTRCWVSLVSAMAFARVCCITKPIHVWGTKHGPGEIQEEIIEQFTLTSVPQTCQDRLAHTDQPADSQLGATYLTWRIRSKRKGPTRWGPASLARLRY